MVYITPIISRSATGQVVAEAGAGGGAGDLDQSHDIRFDNLKADEAKKLIDFCTDTITDVDARLRMVEIVSKALASKKDAVLLNALKAEGEDETMPLQDLVQRLAGLAGQEEPNSRLSRVRNAKRIRTSQGEFLPKYIVCLPTQVSSLAK